MANVRPEDVVEGFGDEWSRFTQASLDDAERATIWREYFAQFPWEDLPADAEGFDAGCGSGRWALLVSERVGRLHCIDASDRALAVATANLAGRDNVVFHHARVEDAPLPVDSQDFGYSLGVLHHIPDTEVGLRHLVSTLKPGAPFLLYLYYAFDNRPAWYRLLWRLSEAGRAVISRAPYGLRYLISQVIAAGVYWPLARLAAVAEWAGLGGQHLPLAYYRHRSFYVMRTDALDRFGTRLERRFTRTEILRLMERAGLTRVRFSDAAPFWCAVGYRREP